MTPLKAQAIQTALMGDWENAIALNQLILQDIPDDIDTLNRLAFAFASQGNSKEAKNIYQKVLQLDAQNPIAMRNLKRLGINSGKSNHTFSPVHMTNLFIEEPGKTKVVELINVADKKVISPLRSGESLQLCIKRMKIFILDSEKQYIGMLPDDLGKRLIKFMDGGNKYDAFVKSVESNKVIIFARETHRVTKFKNQASFVSSDKSKKFVLENSTSKVATHQKNSKQLPDIEDEIKSYSDGEEEEEIESL